MPLISLRQMLDHAAENGYGVPAFNVNNMEQIHAIMEAAAETDSPVIAQASAGARSYAGPAFLRHLIEAAIEQWPQIPIVMHQDHGASPAVCQRSIQLGFSSVMMDGSLGEDMKTPMSYEYNADVTRRVVDMAHACGIPVEGELGYVPGVEGEDAERHPGEIVYTTAADAKRYVDETGVDFLAVSIGTLHGRMQGEPKLDFERLAGLQEGRDLGVIQVFEQRKVKQNLDQPDLVELLGHLAPSPASSRPPSGATSLVLP